MRPQLAERLPDAAPDLIIVDDPLNANEVNSETARKRVIRTAAHSSRASMTNEGLHYCGHAAPPVSDGASRGQEPALNLPGWACLMTAF